LEPDNVNINASYASFLSHVKKDIAASEEKYSKVLVLAPDNARVQGNYALFLGHVKKDLKAAETHYLKALELEPENVNNIGNYAGLLFSLGRVDEGLKYLEQGRNYLDFEHNKELMLECYFYEYAHIESKRETAEVELLALLEQGVVSPEFDLSTNVERAISDGHSHPEKLREYAEKITSE